MDPIDGHFFYLFAPPTLGVAAVHKAISFVIDVSGSMQGQRIQVETELVAVTGELGPGVCFLDDRAVGYEG